jgi:HK97 gp10 family phage protein
MNISPSLDNYIKELERFASDEPEIAKRAVIAGAQPVADAIRSGMKSLPVDHFRKLKEDETFEVLSKEQLKDLEDSMGIAPVSVDDNGNTNTKVGFKGYGRFPTKTYPQGLPNALLARAVESGSSVRKKTPFVRPAVNKSTVAAVEKMDQVINDAVKIYAL